MLGYIILVMFESFQIALVLLGNSKIFKSARPKLGVGQVNSR